MSHKLLWHPGTLRSLLVATSLIAAIVVGSRTFYSQGASDAQASARIPASSYDCSATCWGVANWPGNVIGAGTTQTIVNLNCTPTCSSNGYWVQDGVWLMDFNHQGWNCLYGACWVMVGQATVNTTDLYYWEDNRPGGGLNQHTGEATYLDDNHSSEMEAYQKAGTTTSWSVWASSFQYGTGVAGTSTSNGMQPDTIRAGLRIYGASGGGTIQSAPSTDFIYNMWYNGAWIYQTNGGSPYPPNPAPPTNAYWKVVPHSGNNGGDLGTNCGC